MLLAFPDKLRLMSLLIDDIKSIKEFPLRSCRESKFSNGGQYFAAVNSTTIFIHSTWSYELVATLKGHIGKIRSIHWSDDDTRLISSGMDGAVYEWNVFEGRRESENVLKSCSYYSAILASKSGPIYATGNDNRLRAIQDGQVVKEYNLNASVGHLFLAQTIFIAGKL